MAEYTYQFEDDAIAPEPEGATYEFVDEPERPGLWSRTGANLKEAWTEATTAPVSFGETASINPIYPIVEKATAIGAPLGRAAFDLAVEAAKGAYEYGVSPITKKSISDVVDYIGNTDVLKSQLQTLKGLREAWGKLEKAEPRGTKFVENVIESTNLIPAWQVAKAGGVIPKAVVQSAAEVLPPIAEKLYASSVKAPLTKKWTEVMPGKELSARKAAVEAGLREHIPPSDYGVAKVTKLEKETRELVDEIIGEGAAKGDFVNTEDILSKGLDRAYRKAKNASDPEGAKQIISDIAEKFRAHGETIPSNKLNDIKRALYDEVKWGGTEQTAMVSKFTAMGKKGIAHEAMTQLEEFYPDLKGLNKKDAAYINLKEIVEKSAARISNHDMVGLGAKALFVRSIPTAIFEWTIGHPAVKSRVAFILNDIGKKLSRKPSPITPTGPAGGPPPSPIPEGVEGIRGRGGFVSPEGVDQMIPYYAEQKRLFDSRRLPPGEVPLELPPGQGFEFYQQRLLREPYEETLQLPLDRRGVPVGEARGGTYHEEFLPVVSQAPGQGFTSIPKTKTSGVNPMDTTRQMLRRDIGRPPEKFAVSDSTMNRPQTFDAVYEDIPEPPPAAPMRPRPGIALKEDAEGILNPHTGERAIRLDGAEDRWGVLDKNGEPVQGQGVMNKQEVEFFLLRGEAADTAEKVKTVTLKEDPVTVSKPQPSSPVSEEAAWTPRSEKAWTGREPDHVTAEEALSEAEFRATVKEPAVPPAAAGRQQVLYHGTNAEYGDAEITGGKKMYGIHLTTDEAVAKDYGKVKKYVLAKDAKVLDLSDGDTLWGFMKKEGILDAEDIRNIDLENYTKNGQLFQYDISGKTHLADDVAKTAESLGYDVIKMPDDLGGRGDNVVQVVVNKKVLQPATVAPPPAAAGPGGGPDAMLDEFATAFSESAGALRKEISNVRYGMLEEGKPGEILFEFRGKTYRAPEPTDVMPVGHGEASQSWALTQLLDKKAVPISTKGMTAREARSKFKGKP